MDALKKFRRAALVHWLAWLSRGVLWRRKPRVVAVTGSVGKTTTKELAARMLSERFRVRGSEGNYNTEIGVPLTVFGAKLPKRWSGWWEVTMQAFGLMFSGEDYPEMLVLELAADKPGDLAHLTSFVRPDVAIVTNVRGVHLEFYRDIEHIQEEKSWIVRRLKGNGIAVLNYDDARTKEMKVLAEDRVVSYGLEASADASVTGITQDAQGQRGTLVIKKTGQPQSYPLKTALLGLHQLYAIMAAAAAANELGVDPKQALAAVAAVDAPPGRLRLFRGKGGMTILDDTYNSSPQGALAALEVLYRFPKPRRAVLGDMKELGKGSTKGHRDVGEVAGRFLDELVVVGDDAMLIAEAAKDAGMKPSKIHFAGNADEAATLVNQDKKGGTVLIKASQAMYLERTVKALLVNRQDEKYLVQRLKDPYHREKADAIDRAVPKKTVE